ncbi:MAG: biopolymer transporter ExbD [Pseudomonadota bacterium]
MTRLTRPRRGPAPDPIVSLVDVVFFLLVFAMLIGRMDATAAFAVDPPRAQTGADLPTGGATISLSSSAELALDGSNMAQADAIAALMPRIAADPTLRVRVNADGALSLRHVLPLIDALRSLGAEGVVLVVTPGN